MPAMVLPAKHTYYIATIRIVVSCELGASDYIEVPVKVSCTTTIIAHFLGPTVIKNIIQCLA